MPKQPVAEAGIVSSCRDGCGGPDRAGRGESISRVALCNEATPQVSCYIFLCGVCCNPSCLWDPAVLGAVEPASPQSFFT